METNTTVEATALAVPWLTVTVSIFSYIGTGLYYIALPIVKLLLVAYYVLRYILSPFVATARGFVQLLLIPWHIVAKFEVCRV